MLESHPSVGAARRHHPNRLQPGRLCGCVGSAAGAYARGVTCGESAATRVPFGGSFSLVGGKRVGAAPLLPHQPRGHDAEAPLVVAESVDPHQADNEP